jgi:hypothetical protein
MNTIIARNRFPVLAAALVAAAVLVGFARTFYLRGWFDLPPLTRAAHIHGVLWTAWLVLHYVQARLIAAHRVDIHKRLGIAGAVLGIVLVISTALVTIASAKAGHGPPQLNPLQFMSVSMGSTVTFAGFLIAALALRKKREWHKRLMLLASLVMIMPAIGRIDGLLFKYFDTPRAVLPFFVTCLFLAWAWYNDWRTRKTVHPAFLYGGALLIAAIPFRFWIGHTDAWMVFAKWITAG